MEDPTGDTANEGTANTTMKKDTMKRWTNDRLITASISHIPRFDEDKLAADLEKIKLWKHVTGISVSGNRRIMELELDDVNHARTLLDGGLATHGRTLLFREATTKRVTVSLLGVPLGFPDRDIRDEMTYYGSLDRLYRLTKTIRGRTLQTGTVILKYDELDEPIPRNLDIADRRIRTIYTGQDRHIAQWQQMKDRQATTHDDANEPTNDNRARDEPPTNADTTSNATPDLTVTQTLTATGTEAETPASIQPTNPGTENGSSTTDPSRTPEQNAWRNRDEQMDTTASTNTRKRTKDTARFSDTEAPTNKQPQGSISEEVSETDLSKPENNPYIPFRANPEAIKTATDYDPFTEDLEQEILDLKPGSATMAEIVNFIKSRARGIEKTRVLVKKLTGLTVPDEIHEFIGLYLYKLYGDYAKNKLKQCKDYPDEVLKEWATNTQIKHVDRESKIRTYIQCIQGVWANCV